MKDFGNEQPLVLALDSDSNTLNDVTTVLLRANLACVCCTTAEAAIAAAQETPPDLILCNVNLQGESGPETCQRIKQQAGLADVPVMFLSGVQLPDIIRRTHQNGGIYCLRKPFDPNVLVELIDQALSVSEGVAAG
jgi:CheY-like chemotaxis protein